MEIRQLKSFLAVARLLSFNRAADQLHYAQSSISAQIRTLEEELKVRLFDRLGRRIMLTEAGERLVRYAEKMVALEKETTAEIADEEAPAGALTIRIPESYGICRLPSGIKRFHDQFPRVQLNFITCSHEGLQEDLRKGVTDLAFLLTESVRTADLEVEMLGVEPIVLVAPAGHRLAASKRVRTADLAGETLLLSKVDCSYRKQFEQILNDQGVALPPAIIFHSVAALKQCAIQGVGVTILPEVMVRRDILRGKLVALHWEEGRLETALLMIWYKKRWLSPSLKAFMNAARAAMI